MKPSSREARGLNWGVWETTRGVGDNKVNLPHALRPRNTKTTSPPIRPGPRKNLHDHVLFLWPLFHSTILSGNGIAPACCHAANLSSWKSIYSRCPGFGPPGDRPPTSGKLDGGDVPMPKQPISPWQAEDFDHVEDRYEFEDTADEEAYPT